MKINRRLILLGVMLVVLSTVMATQYATTRVAYSFGIVHPSNADIRFVASDFSSGDNKTVLRVMDNSTTTQFVTIQLGDWMPNSDKNYTAAFAIVNEEPFPLNISYMNVSGAQAKYVSIWLHGNRTKDVSHEVALAKAHAVIGNGVTSQSVTAAGGCVWKLGAGNYNVLDMNGSQITTGWLQPSHVRYSVTDSYAKNGTTDFVWVEISLSLPTDAPSLTAASGTIYLHFEATTH